MPRHLQRHSAMSCAKMAELIEMPFGSWTWMCPRSMCCMVCTVAPPGEYDWSIHVRVDRMKQWKCSPVSNYFDDLLFSDTDLFVIFSWQADQFNNLFFRTANNWCNEGGHGTVLVSSKRMSKSALRWRSRINGASSWLIVELCLLCVLLISAEAENCWDDCQQIAGV